MKSVIKLKSEIKKQKAALLTKGSFIQNMGWSMSGNVVVIASQLIFAPLLTRVYGPEAYGSFALLNATAINISSISTLYYDKALILPKNDNNLIALLRLCLYCIAAVSAIILCIVIFIPSLLTNGLGIPDTPQFLYGLVVFVVVLSLLQVATSWILRNRYFKDAMIYNAPVTVGTRLFNLGYGVLTKGGIIGLAIGEILGKVIVTFLYFRYILNKDFQRLYPFSTSTKDIKKIANEYRKFPLYDMPGNWLGIVGAQLPLFFLANYAGVTFLGFFGLASSLLELPVRLLGYSLAGVFTAKAAELQQGDQIDRIGGLIQKLFWSLFLLCIIPFGLLIYIGPDLFSFVFGAQWLMAGKIAAVLAMSTFSNMLVDPFAGIFRVTQQQHKTFFLQVGGLLIKAILLIVLVKLQVIPLIIIGWYAMANGVINVWGLAQKCLIAKIPIFQITLMLIALLASQLITVFLLL